MKEIPKWFIGEFFGTFLLVFFSEAGWSAVPFAANGHGWLTVYILAPVLGGILGGGVYRLFFKPNYAGSEQDRCRS